jgi:recombination endonuclease VII
MVSPKSIRHRKRYAEDPEYRERKLARDRRYLAAHKDEINQRRRERLRTDHEYWERQRNFRRYGVAPADYHRLLARQGGLCSICKKKPDRPLGVDHCHPTRQIRALLCIKCNAGLGQYDEDTALLLAAIAYLEAWRRGIDELADVTVTAAEVAEKLRQQLELALRAAFSLRAASGDTKVSRVGGVQHGRTSPRRGRRDPPARDAGRESAGRAGPFPRTKSRTKSGVRRADEKARRGGLSKAARRQAKKSHPILRKLRR